MDPSDELEGNLCLDPNTLKLVNCAMCGAPLTGRSMERDYKNLTNTQRARFRIPELMYVRYKGRPYCKRCGLHRLGS